MTYHPRKGTFPDHEEKHMRQFIRKYRRSLTITAATAVLVAAPAVNAFAYVHNG